MRRHAQVRRYLTAFDTARLPQVFTDVVVLGSGVAALRAALEMAPALQVTLVTKSRLTESNSYYAQGGIAAAVAPPDTVESHMADTLATGCGLSDEAVVRQVVTAAPDCIRELVDWGAVFDRTGPQISVGREGGHSAARIIHARGDETGKEITSTLLRRAAASDSIDIREETFVIDLLSAGDRIVGVLAWHPTQGAYVIQARRTVLASGGLGRIYRETTNPEVATGDGLAMAYRAGAVLADMEFVQFHPTTLYIAGASRHLISETVRGEGARLVDKTGHAFMAEYHPQGDLAARDVVSRAIVDHLRKTGETHVFLDLAHLGSDVRKRFPGIAKACASSASTSPATRSRSGLRPITWSAASRSTSRAAPASLGSWPAARSRPRACTGPTAWVPTASWKAWSSAAPWAAASSRTLPPRAGPRPARRPSACAATWSGQRGANSTSTTSRAASGR